MGRPEPPPVRQLSARLRAYVRVTAWDRPADLLLYLWPLFVASWLAGQGGPNVTALCALLLAVFLLRSAGWAWRYRCEIESRYRPEIERLSAALAVTGLCFALPLGWPLLLLPLAAGSIWLAFRLQRRSYLAHTAIALAVAWLVLAAYTAQGVVPDKAAGLLFVAALFWAVALLILLYLPRRARDAGAGVLTLPVLFGAYGRQAVAGFQLGALIALWLAGRQLALGIFFALGLGTAGALTLYQQFLLFRDVRTGWRSAVVSNAWWGIAVFCGVAFHYLCPCA